MSGLAAAIDLGGTNTRAAVIDEAGAVVRSASLPTPRGGWDDIVTAILELVGGVGGDGLPLGVAIAALVDRDGVARRAPNVPGIDGTPVGAELSARLGVIVAVDNDATAAAAGELAFGAARGARHALVVTLGTGIGGGIVAEGAVMRGGHGFAAEIGHWPFAPDPDDEPDAGEPPRCACGAVGHWEAWASGNALGALARARAASGHAPAVLERAGGALDAVSGLVVGQAALDGDPDARAVLERYGRRVGSGLAGLVNILDPELVVVSGGLVTLGDLLLDTVREAMAPRLVGASSRPVVPLVPAALGEHAGLVGAAVLARDAVRA